MTSCRDQPQWGSSSINWYEYSALLCISWQKSISTPPVPEHLHNSLLTRYLITEHFHRRPLSTDGAQLFTPQKGDGIGKARPCLDVNLDENWFVNVAFIMHEKKQNKKTLLVYQWCGAVCSRWGKSLGEVWTRGSTLELSSANLPPSWSPITWPFASFSLYVCLCNSFYTAA